MLTCIQIKRKLENLMKDKNRIRFSEVVGARWEECSSMTALRKVLFEIRQQALQEELEAKQEEKEKMKEEEAIQRRKAQVEWELQKEIQFRTFTFDCEEKRKQSDYERSEESCRKARDAFDKSLGRIMDVVKEAYGVSTPQSQITFYFIW